ncbi:hypothetical protein GGI23_005437, partial [Coemansia sp. RSA 2559]
MEHQHRSDDQNGAPPTAQFENMSMGNGPLPLPPNKNAAAALPPPAPGYVGTLASPDSPDDADFGTDTNNGFDDEGYSHYRHINHDPQQHQQQGQVHYQQQYQQAQYQPMQQQQVQQQYVQMQQPEQYQQHHVQLQQPEQYQQHHVQLQQPEQYQQQPQQYQQQPQHAGMQMAPAPSFQKHFSENDVATEPSNLHPLMHQQLQQPHLLSGTQSPHVASSTSSIEDISSGSDTLPAPRAAAGNAMLHRYSSQPRLSADMGSEFTAIPRPRPGRSGLAPQSSASLLSNGEPNPFLTYARNSIYSSSQTSLARGSIYGLAGANTMSAKRMSRTLVSGNGNALDMYREAAKKTQDQRIQLEYAKFLLQSIENLEDPVVREDINVTYSIYLPGGSGGGGDIPGLSAIGGGMGSA